MTALPQQYRGERLGLPAAGRGSLASLGARSGAFVIDVVASALVAGLFVQFRHAEGAADHLPGSWSLVPLALDYVLGVLLTGRTVGMTLLGLRLVRIDRDEAIGPGRILLRTALLFLLVPAVITDRDLRGLHDRLTDTAVIRG